MCIVGESWTLPYVLELKSSAASLAGGLHLALPVEPAELGRPKSLVNSWPGLTRKEIS